jgi:hypothetical protein
VGSYLGDILVEAGVIDHEQLEGYSSRARSQSTHIGLLLIEDGICTDREIAESIGLHLGHPLVQLSQLRIPGFVAKLLPRENAENLAAIPVSIKQEGDQEILYAAFFDPTDEEAIAEVTRISGKVVKPVAAALSDIRGAIKRYYVPVKRRTTGEQRAVGDSGATPTTSSSAKLATLPPNPPEQQDLQPVPDEHTPLAGELWDHEDAGLDLPEAELDDDFTVEHNPDLSASSLNEKPVAEAVDVELDLGDLDLSFDESSADEIEVEPVAVDVAPLEEFEGTTADDRESVDFADMDDDFSPDDFAVEQTGHSEPKAEGPGSSGALDFLSFNDAQFRNDDEDILRRQAEAENVQQDVPFGVDADLDFDDPASEATNDRKAVEPTAVDSDKDDFFGDLDFEDGEAPTDEFIESWEDDNFDLRSDETAPHKAAPSKKRAVKAEPAENEQEDDFDLDFDIPEAPEFMPGSSGSFASVRPAAEPVDPPQHQPQAVAQTLDTDSEDWSLDVDSLFDRMTEELTSVSEAAAPPDEIDFETASRELDRLLAGATSETQSISDSRDQDDLARELTRMITDDANPDSGDVDLIARLLSGESRTGDGRRLQELSQNREGVARKLLDMGLISDAKTLDRLLDAEAER